MNLLLLNAAEVDEHGCARLGGRRLTHAREVLKAQVGERLRVGVLGGLVGTAEILSLEEEELCLQVELHSPPPPRANVSIILAVPRPKALKRIIPAVASLGVEKLVLLNAARVEKSYFDSKVLAPSFVDELMRLGLEQACDTIAPQLEIRQHQREFLEHELDRWAPAEALRLLPHPRANERLGPVPSSCPVVLAIGPDGGWIPQEVELFARCGFTPVSMGERVLRSEVAICAALGAVRAGLPRAM
jgi:RsmE family RNA methyltransferase